MNASDKLLYTDHLALEFDGGHVRALDGVDLHVQRGEFVALMGPSGCGKSSLLSLIGLLDQPSRGEIHFESQPYSAIDDRAAFRRNNIGFIFQSFFLLPTLSAMENVLVATIGASGRAADHASRAAGLLRDLGVDHKAAKLPSQLSGGERQRVAIARALINSPKLILADEPTGSLDSQNADQVLGLLQRMRNDFGLTVLMATHDPSVSSSADRAIHRRDGCIVPNEVSTL